MFKFIIEDYYCCYNTIIPSLYNWNRGLENLSNLLSITQLVSGEAEVWTDVRLSYFHAQKHKK